MNNKIYLNQKLDLLLISLESLDVLQADNLIRIENPNIYKHHYSNQKINNNIIELIRYAISIRKYRRITYSCFTNFIIYIYQIHKRIDCYMIYQKANLILRHYIQNNKSSSFKQYIRKFNYLYFEQNHYYINYKHIDHQYKKNIKQIAIQNLYFITKLINKQGIYLLVRYLYN